MGPRSSRNAPSISTILLPTHRADRTGWLPKIKKKKRERKKKEKNKKGRRREQKRKRKTNRWKRVTRTQTRGKKGSYGTLGE